MTNTSIQMDLLSEVRTQEQVLSFAINRERGQANQHEILKAHSSNTNWSNVSYIRNNTRNQQQQRQFRQPILPTPPTGKIEPCFKCGQPFIRNHLNMCKAQNFTCQICKKTGHYTSMCKAPMPEKKKPTMTRQENRYMPQQQLQNTRRVRHIQEEQEQATAEEEEETVDGEAALYIKELMEDWSSINIVRPTGFKEVNNVSLNKDTSGEFWLKTKYRASEIDWLADTGSPGSFMQESIAKEITARYPDSSISKFTEKTKYKCFNNQDIQIKGVLNINLKSGFWKTTDCKILSVNNLPQNVMGRDILRKLGIQLTASKPKGKTVGLISDTTIEQNIIKWIFRKYPHLCTRLGRSKNHVAKSTLKENFKPTQHMGRRVTLHLLERVEKELGALIEDKQIKRLENAQTNIS